MKAKICNTYFNFAKKYNIYEYNRIGFLIPKFGIDGRG